MKKFHVNCFNIKLTLNILHFTLHFFPQCTSSSFFTDSRREFGESWFILVKRKGQEHKKLTVCQHQILDMYTFLVLSSQAVKNSLFTMLFKLFRGIKLSLKKHKCSSRSNPWSSYLCFLSLFSILLLLHWISY